MDSSLVPAQTAVLTVFNRTQRLSVRQRKRWLEILTSFDARNTYAVYDEVGNPVLNVQEQGKGFGNFLKRIFLGAFRPFTSHVEDMSGQGTLLHLRRPFRFYFHRLEVRDAAGTLIGTIRRRWTWFRRKYTVEGAQGQEIATLFGPFWRPWTFKIIPVGASNKEEVGLIQKKWSGLAKEFFTQADNFWIQFDNVPDPAARALYFSATVLIDVVHFERKN